MAKHRIATVAVIVYALTFAAFAEVGVNLSATKILVRNGKEARENADRVKPGEVLEYVAVYENKDKAPARGVMATLPIPSGTEFVPASGNPQDFQISTDGKQFGKYPLMRKAKDARGQEVMTPVPVKEYRFLRWALGDLAPGAKKSVKARVKVVTAEAQTK